MVVTQIKVDIMTMLYRHPVHPHMIGLTYSQQLNDTSIMYLTSRFQGAENFSSLMILELTLLVSSAHVWKCHFCSTEHRGYT